MTYEKAESLGYTWEVRSTTTGDWWKTENFYRTRQAARDKVRYATMNSKTKNKKYKVFRVWEDTLSIY